MIYFTSYLTALVTTWYLLDGFYLISSWLYNWNISIGLHDIYQLRSISSFWPLDDKELINIEQVFVILRKIRDELTFEIKELEKLL